MSARVTLTILALAALPLMGCQDPYRFAGTWDAGQVNAVNLAVQAADWRDLASGHGHPDADGQEAAQAVERLRQGKVKPLANFSTSSTATAAPPDAAPVTAPSAAAVAPASN